MITDFNTNLKINQFACASKHVCESICSLQFVIALGIMAFVILINLIIVVKVRQDFFLIESSPLTLFNQSAFVVPQKEKSGFLIKERAAAITTFMRKNKQNNIELYFEEGKKFVFPQESKKILTYLEKRKNNIVYISLLTRINNPQNSRVKIWNDKSISFSEMKVIMGLFSRFGFDSFDFAMNVQR